MKTHVVATRLLKEFCRDISNRYVQHMFCWRNKKNIWIPCLSGAVASAKRGIQINTFLISP